MSWAKEQMALKASELISDGASVNLGIGLPTLVADPLSVRSGISIHSENGVLGVGPRPRKNQVSPTLINAGKETISILPGASYFDSALSFGMIRGGHLDYSVLGAMEVDCQGNLANWMIPGKKITGMGGAMDLVNGAKQVIVMMGHFSKHGECKLKAKCELPLTGQTCVDLVVTELGVFKVMGDHFKILEMASGEDISQLGPSALFKK